MKILYIIDSYFEPNAGGRDINIHTIANYMHEKGHEVTVLTAQEPVKSDFEYNVIWPKGKNTTVVRGKKFLEILKGDYDIASLHDAGGFSFGIKTPIAKILNLKKCPFVYTLHMPKEVHTNWDNMVSTMKEANHVIFVDYFMLKYIKDYDFKNYIYLPSPINTKMFSNTNQEFIKAAIWRNSELVVSTLSRIDLEHKNVDFILRLAEKFIDDDIKFVIIGGGDGESTLRNIIKNNQIKNILLTGEIKNEVVNKYLDSVDVMVNTSNWPGTGRNVLEAMATGKIVIRRCTEGDDPVLVNGENFIKYSSLDELERIIREIKNNRNKYNVIQQNAKSTFESNYSIEIVGKKFESIYNNVINSRGVVNQK